MFKLDSTTKVKHSSLPQAWTKSINDVWAQSCQKVYKLEFGLIMAWFITQAKLELNFKHIIKPIWFGHVVPIPNCLKF